MDNVSIRLNMFTMKSLVFPVRFLEGPLSKSPCIMSVQYTEGVQYKGMFSTRGGCCEYSGGYHQYTGGVQYTGKIS